MKNSNHNKPVSEEKSFCTWRDYFDFEEQNALQRYPSKEDWRKRLIVIMLKFADDPKSLEILQFCKKTKIPRRTLYKMAEDFEDFRKAFEDMKLSLAGNRRVGSMTKKLEGQYAYKDMHKLDPEWDGVNKYHAELKNKDDKDETKTFNIFLPDADGNFTKIKGEK